MKHQHIKKKPQQQSSGFSITESLIAATILLASTNFSVQFFTSNEFESGKLNDYVHAVIKSNLESVRSNLSDWSADTSSATESPLFTTGCRVPIPCSSQCFPQPASSQATSYGLDLSNSQFLCRDWLWMPHSAPIQTMKVCFALLL